MPRRISPRETFACFARELSRHLSILGGFPVQACVILIGDGIGERISTPQQKNLHGGVARITAETIRRVCLPSLWQHEVRGAAQVGFSGTRSLGLCEVNSGGGQIPTLEVSHRNKTVTRARKPPAGYLT